MADNSSRSSIPTYAIRAVKKRTVDRAQRYAVLTPLVGRHDTAESSTADTDNLERIAEDMVTLRSMWVARVTALRQAGWKWVRRGANWTYVAGCPPFSVLTSGPAFKPCRHTAVCPYCWARNVVREAYERLEYACYTQLKCGIGPKAVQDRRRASYDLVEVTFVARALQTPQTLRGIFDAIRTNGPGNLRSLLPEALGAFTLHTIEPEKDRKGRPIWTLRQRILALIPANAPWPEERHTRIKNKTLRRTHGISRKIIMLAVGRTCRYPEWMLKGPAESVQYLLEARGEGGRGRAQRLSAFYGLLRNKSHRDRQASD